MYTIEDLKGKKIAVRTPTEEEFRIIMKTLVRDDVPFFNAYGEDTVVSESGYGYTGGYHADSGYEFISFSDVILPRELKVGDEVEPIKYPFEMYDWLHRQCSTINDRGECDGTYKIETIEGEFFMPTIFSASTFRLSDFKKVQTDKTETSMKEKQSFSIEGSLFLRRALLQELHSLGMSEHFTGGLNEFAKEKTGYIPPSEYIGVYSTRWIGLLSGKESIHYILPQDYNKALQKFRDYFKKEPEFEKGDIVWREWKPNMSSNGKVDVFEVIEFKNGGLYSSDDNFLRDGRLLESSVDRTTNPVATLDDVRYTLRLATPEEIKKYKSDLLIAEAKKRGYKYGVKVSDLASDGTLYNLGKAKVLGENITYYPEDDQILMSQVRIYCKGKWAEILPDDIKIGGHTLEVTPGKTAKFGCQIFSAENIRTFMRLFNTEVDAKITIQGTKITRELLQNILDRLK